MLLKGYGKSVSDPPSWVQRCSERFAGLSKQAWHLSGKESIVRDMKVVSTEKEGVAIGEVDSKMLDASTVSAFRDAVKPMLTEKAQVVLDLSKVEFIDSSGLGALVACLRQAHASGGDIKLFGLGKSARALFELVRMHRVFEVFNSADEAISSYRA